MSWGIARALLLMGTQRDLRILCAREIQNSISESVHKLLSDQIVLLGLEAHYTVLQHTIKNNFNKTEFNFEGIRHNIGRIRSYEGIDICWVVEAAKISKTSWDVLIPTVRKAGSEIWIDFNPELETDETYQRFVVNIPQGAQGHDNPNFRWEIHKLSWRDNPWFPEVLRAEMETLKDKDYDAYLHVWEGFCLKTVEGAIYAREIQQAELDNRICEVPLEKGKAVDWFWDLGRSDLCCGWGVQLMPFETRIVDYIEDSQHDWEHYMLQMQDRRHLIGTIWLPHDAKAKTIGTKKSVEEMTRAVFGAGRVRIVPRLSIADGINAVRTIFPRLYFDKIKCHEGIQGLRRYRYEVKEGQRSANPVHDEASHPADALRYLAVGLKEPKFRTDNLAAVRSKLKLSSPSNFLESWMR